VTPRARLVLAYTAAWTLCLFPLVRLAWRFTDRGLGTNPIEYLTHWSGQWTLNLLVATLAVTPIRRLARWNEIVRVRRTLGLAAFSYASLHFAIYAGLDQFFALEYILEDILERPYITVGFASLVLLVPLAVTSTKRWIRRLGRRWQLLHRLVYPAVALGIVHYLWQVRADTRAPLLYGAAFLLLMALRIRIRPRGSRQSRPTRRLGARESA
jgi:methionine sulfoxide reductase heme-binding subunit